MLIHKKSFIIIKIALPVLTTAILFMAVAGMLTSCGSKSVQGPTIDGEESYHVIVAGGEPEGVAAALSAARNGMRVLLVEDDDALGGLMTLGMLNFIDQNYGPDRELLTQGIFNEFFEALGNAFDIEEAKTWFMNKCRDEPNITVMLNTEILAPVMDGKTIIGLEIKEKGASSPKVVRSLAVIDASVDGDMAAAAGVPYTLGGEDYCAHGALQGVTLVFEIAGVDRKSIVDYLMNDDDPYTGATEKTAWGYGKEAQNYTPTDSSMLFRGPNIAWQKNGNVLLNALILFGVDACDPASYAEGIERGQREIPYLIEFMRENFAGFENVSFVRHASQLYVRETRHILGEYRLTITDVLENRDHWDRIGHGSYAVDVHATGSDNTGNIIGQPDIYSIPFRCLVPLEIDQLLITGRSASYDSLPHGSARVIPVGMVTGEACGVAVAYSVLSGATFRQMTHDPEAILWLQNKLKDQGAYLVEYEPPRPAVMDHWAYSGVAVMRELGMAAGGYKNDYQLEKALQNRWALQSRANGLMRILNERTAHMDQHQIPALEVTVNTDEITVGRLLLTTAQCASLGEIAADVTEAENYLIQRGILDINDLHHFSEPDDIATNGQLFYVMGRLYTTLMEASP